MSLITKGQIITAAKLNQIRTGVNGILGVGSGDSGYGQDVSLPNAINVGQILTAALFDALRTDMTKCYVHQQNANPTTVDASTLSGTLFPPNLQDVEVGDIITADLINQYNNFINETGGIVENRLTCHPNQRTSSASPINLFASNPTYTTAWNGTIIHDITLTWNGYTTPGGTAISAANHKRIFFNAGGVITIQATRTGGSSTDKNTFWTSLLNNAAGLIEVDSSNIDSLQFGYVKIYEGTLGVGVYAENIFRVYASSTSTTTLDFRIEFSDLDTGGIAQPPAPGSSPGEPPGPVVDENVDGTLTTIAGCLTANTSNVSVPMTRGTTFTAVSNYFGPGAPI